MVAIFKLLYDRIAVRLISYQDAADRLDIDLPTFWLHQWWAPPRAHSGKVYSKTGSNTADIPGLLTFAKPAKEPPEVRMSQPTPHTTGWWFGKPLSLVEYSNSVLARKCRYTWWSLQGSKDGWNHQLVLESLAKYHAFERKGIPEYDWVVDPIARGEYFNNWVAMAAAASNERNKSLYISTPEGDMTLNPGNSLLDQVSAVLLIRDAVSKEVEPVFKEVQPEILDY